MDQVIHIICSILSDICFFVDEAVEEVAIVGFLRDGEEDGLTVDDDFGDFKGRVWRGEVGFGVEGIGEESFVGNCGGKRFLEDFGCLEIFVAGDVFFG